MAEEVEREVWSSKIDFFLSALGFAVGFGAIWRFPYLVFENGGGAFLIPYIFMLFAIGFPLFFIEMTLGQYSSCGPVRSFKNICPIFGGVGCGMIVNSFLIMLYYNMILAWTLYYLYTIAANCIEFVIAGIGGRPTGGIDILDWASCNREWSTPNCADVGNKNKSKHFAASNTSLCDNLLINNSTSNFTAVISEICHNVTSMRALSAATASSSRQALNNSNKLNNSETSFRYEIVDQSRQARRVSPGEEFFYNRLLGLGEGIDDWSWPLPQLIVPLAVAWLIAFLCLARGIKQSGKIVWVTSTFPYFILIILLIRGAFLPGASEGVRYFIQPDLKHLLNPDAWIRAAGMILFLLSVGSGGLATYASYNEFHHNIYLDSITIPLLDVGASIIGGFCVFSYVGFIAYTLDVPVPKAVREGTGLLFIALPEATTQMPVSVIWAVALCLMMLMLGMDTQFAFVETCVTAMLDEWPQLRKYKVYVFAIMSVGGFALGIVMTLKNGYFWLNLIDYAVGGLPLIVFALCEVFVVIIYGPKRLSENVCHMTGKRFGIVMYVMWYAVTPIILIILLVASCIQQSPLAYEGKPYPIWAQVIGWLLTIANIAAIPIYAIYVMLAKHRDKPFRERFRILCRPTAMWESIEVQQKAKDMVDEAHVNDMVHHALSNATILDACRGDDGDVGNGHANGGFAMTTISGSVSPSSVYFNTGNGGVGGIRHLNGGGVMPLVMDEKPSADELLRHQQNNNAFIAEDDLINGKNNTKSSG